MPEILQFRGLEQASVLPDGWTEGQHDDGEPWIEVNAVRSPSPAGFHNLGLRVRVLPWTASTESLAALLDGIEGALERS